MISVLSLAYNQSLYTEMLLASLALPECADIPFELVFIDNGSIDSTRELVQAYPLPENPNFEKLTYYAFPENRGVAAGVNKGFELARTEFVLQADNDVVFGPQSLSIMLAWMQKNPGGMVSPNWPWIQKKLGITYFRDPAAITPARLKKLKKTGLKAKFEASRATGSCWMCSRTLFNKVGGWDSEYKSICASDDFLWRVALSGAERVTVPCPIYHPGKITRNKIAGNAKQQEQDLARFMKKWGAHPEDKSLLRALQKKAGLIPDAGQPKGFWQRLGIRKE